MRKSYCGGFLKMMVYLNNKKPHSLNIISEACVMFGSSPFSVISTQS